MIRAIMFDFDGVIVESNEIKTRTFVQLFEGYPQHIKDSIRRFHLQNGGMSRFDKFRYIYANFLKEPLSLGKFGELCRDFNRLIFDGVINAPMVSGMYDFLKRHKDEYDMYIVSGTPQEEMVSIVKKRKLSKYFCGVYGSPKTKKELIKHILAENSYRPEEVVFLGDSINDYEGSLGTGVEFLAKISDNMEIEQFPGIELKVKIKTVEDLERYLDEKENEPL